MWLLRARRHVVVAYEYQACIGVAEELKKVLLHQASRAIGKMLCNVGARCSYGHNYAYRVAQDVDSYSDRVRTCTKHEKGNTDSTLVIRDPILMRHPVFSQFAFWVTLCPASHAI